MKQETQNWHTHFQDKGQLEVLLNNYSENCADYLGGHGLLNGICTTTHKIKIFHRVVWAEESELMAPVHHLFHHLREDFVYYFGTGIAICTRLLLWEHPKRLLW